MFTSKSGSPNTMQPGAGQAFGQHSLLFDRLDVGALEDQQLAVLKTPARMLVELARMTEDPANKEFAMRTFYSVHQELDKRGL